MNARRLRVELAPSAFLAIVLAGLHATAALCVLVVMPGIAGGLLAALIAALGLAAAWSRALLRARASVRALEVEGDELRLELANGTLLTARPAGRRYVSRFLVAVPLQFPVRRTILVTRDMAGADAFRRLRIWALWGKLPRPVAGQQLPA